MMKRIRSLLAPAWLTAIALAASIFVPASPSASAHAMDYGYLDARIEPNAAYVDVLLDFNDLGSAVPLSADIQTSPPVEELEEALESDTGPLFDYVAGGVKVYRDEMPVEPELAGMSVEMVDGVPLAKFQLVYAGAGDATRIKYDLFYKDVNQTHINFARITGTQGEQEFVFSVANQELSVGERNWVRQAWQFIVLGVEHIFTGYDHILFVLCLLPAARRLSAVVEVVTSFTLGHSITLGLATVGIVQLPGRWVESAIAASIVFVAAQNLFQKDPKHRTITTLLFGLVHGFGFAGILQEMELSREGLLSSLLFFNAGVEIGQIVIVSLAFPLLGLIRRYRTYPRAVAAGSAAVIAVGIFWFVQRVFQFG